jgi:hypothetical protein
MNVGALLESGWDWVGRNANGMIAGALAAGLPLAGILLTTLLAREDAAQAVRLQEVQSIVQQQEEFNELLERFTAQLSIEGTVDEETVASLSSNIVRQHTRVGAFAMNVSKADTDEIASYRGALDEVKVNLQRVRSIQDMDPLGVSLVRLYESQRDLTPILAKVSGKAPQVEN